MKCVFNNNNANASHRNMVRGIFSSKIGDGSLFESVALQSLTEVRVWLRNLPLGRICNPTAVNISI